MHYRTVYVTIFCNTSFQIFDFRPDPNNTLSDSKAVVDLFPAGGDKMSFNVPSVPSSNSRYWMIGTFNGIDGLDGGNGFDVLNTIVSESEFNMQDVCGTSQNLRIANMPPKVNTKGRQRQRLHT